MNRRKFLVNTCLGCVGIAAGLGGVSLFESCATTSTISSSFSNGVLSIPQQLFTATQYQVFSNANLEFDVLVVKQTDGSFKSFSMKCPHKGYAIKADSNGIYCPEHGSEFNADGAVTKGPAQHGLTEYKTVVSNGNILVNTII